MMKTINILARTQKNVILVDGDGNQIKLNSGEIYGVREEYSNDWFEHSGVDEIMADSRTGQVLLKSPTTKGIVAYHKAKEAIEKLGANVFVQNASRNGNSHLTLDYDNGEDDYIPEA